MLVVNWYKLLVGIAQYGLVEMEKYTLKNLLDPVRFPTLTLSK